MPQGVLPAEQLAKVPSTRVPVGIRVRAHERVAARGPVMSIGVCAVMRRFSRADEVARPAFRIAMQLHHRDAVRRLHERDGVRMLVQPGLARVGLHAGAAMAGPT